MHLKLTIFAPGATVSNPREVYVHIAHKNSLRPNITASIGSTFIRFWAIFFFTGVHTACCYQFLTDLHPALRYLVSKTTLGVNLYGLLQLLIFLHMWQYSILIVNSQIYRQCCLVDSCVVNMCKLKDFGCMTLIVEKTFKFRSHSISNLFSEVSSKMDNIILLNTKI